MGSKRKHERHVKRVELEFSAEDNTYTGISSDFSLSGIFIRTSRALPPGTILSIKLYLPGGMASLLKGIVKRAIKTQVSSLKNGMGIELVAHDDNYSAFLSALGATSGPAASTITDQDTSNKTARRSTAENSAPEYLIISCPACGVKNKILKSKLSLGPKCGKCRSALDNKARQGDDRKACSSQAAGQSTGRVSRPFSRHGAASYVPGDLIAGRYQVQEICGGEGKSSMGVVYVCYDMQQGKVIALKTLQKRFLDSKRIMDSFKKEALAWIHLEKHPSIVRAYWAQEIDNQMFIACEYITPDGEGRNTITSYLQDPFSLRKTLLWTIQFCHGMEYACTKGVTPHRDVKPDNIMITMEGDLKITDFGLVGLWDKTARPEEIDGLIQKNQKGLTFLATYNNRIVAGSPPWMAPEQFYGVSEVRSDIYSLGVVLYQLASSGELPFRPRNGDSWGTAHKRYPVPPVAGHAGSISDIIKKCLEKRRENRYKDFAELREDLEKVFKKEISRKTGERPPPPPLLEVLNAGELINKGMSLANLGLFDEAIRKYREGLKINPENASAHYNLGNALVRKGLTGEAIREYREAIKIDRDFSAAHFNLGITLFRKGQLDEAITSYKAAIRTRPDFAEAYVNLGVAFYKKGMKDHAIKAYREAIRINPEFADAYYRLGMTFFDRDMPDEAIEAYREALKIKPDFAEALNNLGSALLKKGLDQEAIASYGKAVVLKPGLTEAYYNIGIAFMRQGLPNEALNAFEEFLKNSQRNDSRIEKAREMINDIKKKLA